MLTKELVDEKVKDFFGESVIGKEVIHFTDVASLILVETVKEYALVTIKDFTSQPIGNIDLLLEKRITKSGNVLKDIAEMLTFFYLNTKENLKGIENKIELLSKEITKEASKLSNSSILGL